MKLETFQRLGRNVADLARAEKFYREALGFRATGPVTEDPALAEILGLTDIRVLRMRLGDQEIDLAACRPAGAPYPIDSGAADLWFQHIAVITHDMTADWTRVLACGGVAISRHGPQQLPAAAGGVTAVKFRDPDGHPLELLAFPAGKDVPSAGFDHTAIAVADVNRSIVFYTALGLSVRARQLNHGPAQDNLDGLKATQVDVVALEPPVRATPHLELLGYRHPVGRPPTHPRLNDIAADWLVFGTKTGGCALLRDLDGHVLLLDGRADR